MPDTWTLKPLCFGEFPAFEKSLFTYGRHAGEKMPAPITGWLLQAGERAILVDTGPSAPEVARRWHYPIHRTAEQVPSALLREVHCTLAIRRLLCPRWQCLFAVCRKLAPTSLP